MSEFRVGNLAPINLNFILYIYNIYKNHNEYALNRFPLIKINEGSLLKSEDVYIELKNLWNEVLDSKDSINNDFEYWIQEKLDFKSFFTDEYEFVKSTFEAWYFGTGMNNGGLYALRLVENYYKDIVECAARDNINLPDELFFIGEVYSCIPESWNRIGRNIVIQSQDMIDIKVNDLLKLYKYKRYKSIVD